MNKLLFMLLLFPASAFSQKDSTKYFKDTVFYSPLPVDSTGAIVFRRVYEVPNTPKSELYARAKIWTAINFRSAKNVIQLDDEDKTSLIIKGVQEGENNLWFTIQFTFKDNKYRVIMSQFWIERFVANYNLVTGQSTKGLERHYPDKEYKELCDYNRNVKVGEDDFNEAAGLTKHHEKQNAGRVQIVSDFAGTECRRFKKLCRNRPGGTTFEMLIFCI